MSKVPEYAAHVPRHELVKLLCKKQCGRSTLAQLRPADPPMSSPHRGTERFAGYEAVCLRCGGIAIDNYNWTAFS